MSYPEFGMSTVKEDDRETLRNIRHDSIMKWLNSGVKFNNLFEQTILSRLMYLTNYGIIYPNREHYTHMNAVLVHDKETWLKYSRRWSFYDRFINLGVYESTGLSIDALLEKTPYEADKIFEMCERKHRRANSQVAELNSQISDLNK